MMPTYTFQGYKGRVVLTFTCPCCNKPNRKRTFTAEHTVNPFNKNSDGSIRTPQEVRRNAYDEAERLRDKFATAPLCASCENALSYLEQRNLSALRSEKYAALPSDSEAPSILHHEAANV